MINSCSFSNEPGKFINSRPFLLSLRWMCECKRDRFSTITFVMPKTNEKVRRGVGVCGWCAYLLSGRVSKKCLMVVQCKRAVGEIYKTRKLSWDDIWTQQRSSSEEVNKQNKTLLPGSSSFPVGELERQFGQQSTEECPSKMATAMKFRFECIWTLVKAGRDPIYSLLPAMNMGVPLKKLATRTRGKLGNNYNRSRCQYRSFRYTFENI